MCVEAWAEVISEVLYAIDPDDRLDVLALATAVTVVLLVMQWMATRSGTVAR